MKRLLPLIVLFVLFTIFVSDTATANQQQPSRLPRQGDADLLARVQENGRLMVIVGLNIVPGFVPEGELSQPALVDRQREAIVTTREQLQSGLTGLDAEIYAEYTTLPYVAMTVDAAALQALLRSPLVTTVQEDVADRPTLASSTAVIGAPAVWAQGYDGSGHAVVILDTGIDAAHSFFGGRVVAEACFSNAAGAGIGVSLCPNGSSTQTGTGAADVTAVDSPCFSGATQLCSHGTHVAGIAAGNGPSFDGVARGADIIAIQVFTRFNSGAILTYSSDQLRALEYIYTDLQSTHTIAAVNMSLGGGQYAGACDSDARKSAIDNLISVDIATVIASGNDSWTAYVASPGCISTAVTVGATTDADAVASFSNISVLVDLLAPGVSIDSAVPGGGFANYNGTSMATPHVTGAWAVLRQIAPGATVADVLTALSSTGIPVTDTRSGGTLTRPRIQLDQVFPPDIRVQPALLTRSQAQDTTTQNSLTIENTGVSELNWSIQEDNATTAVMLPSNSSRDEAGVDAASLTPDTAAAAVNLILDDGTLDTNVGLTSGGSFLWFNRFTPEPTDFAFDLTAVQLYVDSGQGVDTDEEVIVLVYEDTDGDGNPVNATLLAQETFAVVAGSWNTFALAAPVRLNGPGDVLIGIYNTTAGTAAGEYPAAMDQTASQQRSWVGFGSAPFNNLASFSPIIIDDAGIAGNWLVRGLGQTAGPPPNSVCDTPEDIPWASVSPTSGTTAVDDSTPVNVTFDATGLAPGSYNATLCIASNDPDTPEIQVPLTLEVTACSPPPAVTGITIASLGGNMLELTWDAVSGATGYEVWWSTADPYFTPGADCGNPGSLGCAASAATAFQAPHLANAGQHHFYAVKAVDSCGASGTFSNRPAEFEFDIVNN